MIRIELKEDNITSALEALARRLADMTPVMDEIGEVLSDSTKQRFPEGNAPDGTPWAPKSAAALAKSKDARPLFGPTGLLSSQIFTETTSSSVSVGSNRIYAATMQFGASEGAFGTSASGAPIPFGNIPARPFLGISENDRGKIAEIITEWVAEALDPSAG